MATIQEVYIALFGRPADPIGLRFYNEATDNGNNLDAVGDLSNSPEYLDRFEGMSDVQMINQIYQDLFGRDADAQGLLFYTAQLQSGAASVQDIAIRIIDGATGSDQVTIDAKVAAANLFTASLDQGNEIVAYSGDVGIEFGQEFLRDIRTAADVPTQAEVDADIAEFVATDPQNNGPTFTLTSGVDDLVGTSGNDTFQGIVGQTGAFGTGTLNTFDAIDGGAGTDTLNLVVRTSTLADNLDIRNVEIVNLDQTNTTLNSVNASAFGADVEQLWQIENATSVTGLADGQTAGFRATSGAAITVAAGAASVAIALDGVDSGSTFTVVDSGTLDNALNTVSVSGSVAADANNASAARVLNLDIEGAGGTNGITDINLSLTTNTTLNVGAGFENVETIDASGSTGGITAAFAGASSILDLESIVSGSGNDNITAGLARLDGEVSISTGAGNDTIQVLLGVDGDADTSAALTLTGGAGNDSFVFAGGNISAEDNADDGFTNTVTITDFSAGDLLNIDGFDGFSAQIAVNNVIDGLEDDATLYDAVTAVAELLEDGGQGITNSAQFEFGGSTYVYIDQGDTGFGAGDTLIELTDNVALTGQNVVDTVNLAQ
jgi:hypothetical protein